MVKQLRQKFVIFLAEHFRVTASHTTFFLCHNGRVGFVCKQFREFTAVCVAVKQSFQQRAYASIYSFGMESASRFRDTVSPEHRETTIPIAKAISSSLIGTSDKASPTASLFRKGLLRLLRQNTRTVQQITGIGL
jgi:hypothetical protein